MREFDKQSRQTYNRPTDLEGLKAEISQSWRMRMARGLGTSLVLSISILVLAAGALAQQRPLVTEDVDIIKPGVIRIETGLEFLQNQRFPLSGLRGDLTRLADTRLSFGLASNVEFQVEWTFQN